MIAILRREIKGLFSCLTGFLFFGCFVALTGVWMLVYNFYYGYTGFEYSLAMINVTLALLLPLITVPLFAQERREGVARFWRMLPISVPQLVLGKYLITLFALLILTVALALCPLILGVYGAVSMGTAYSGLLAFFLMGWAWVSIDVFLSLMLENKVAIWAVSYGVPVAAIAMGYLAKLIPGVAGDAVSYFSIFGAYTPFLYGLLDVRSLVLWCSIAIVFTVLTAIYAERVEKA